MYNIISVRERITSPVRTGAKSVGTSPTSLFVGEEILPKRQQMIVYNDSTETIYYGDSSVTTATGMPVASGDSVVFNFDVNVTTDIYFVAGVSSNVRIAEI